MSIASADKALMACIQYDFLLREIDRLTRCIGESLSWCPISINADENTPLTKKGFVKTHLAQAFEPEIEDDGTMQPCYIWFDDAEITEFLSECPHCTQAYRQIKERKEFKKRLGAVKRTIRMIGRAS